MTGDCEFNVFFFQNKKELLKYKFNLVTFLSTGIKIQNPQPKQRVNP